MLDIPSTGLTLILQQCQVSLTQDPGAKDVFWDLKTSKGDVSGTELAEGVVQIQCNPATTQ